jgi:hypothetical protein
MSVLSPTISKLYTPPTCTLEVTAKASPLSRWTRTPVIKSLQFLLSFDSSSQRVREPIEIYGDQTQLSALTETVTQYIQTVLASRSSDLPLSAPQTEPSDPAPPEAELTLHPHSLLTHELKLGSLATAQSGPSLLLKVSQIYDLAAALEDCTADLQQMPSLIAAERPAAIMPFLRSAAVVVLTVGLGTATWRLFQTAPVAINSSSSNLKTAVAPSAAPRSSELSPLPSLPSRPLNLPSIQLPQRSDNAMTAGQSGNQTLNSAELPASVEPLPSGQSRSAPAATKTAPSQSIASLPSNELNPSAPNAAGSQADAAAPSIAGSTMRSRALSQAFEAAPAPQKAAGQSTLFDTVPQVAEVRNYIATRWQPSPPPPKTLEYRLTVNADGSLDKVEPLGASAQQYLNQVPLPQSAAAFVAPSGTRSNIRLLLRQDGTVQTFLDESGQ